MIKNFTPRLELVPAKMRSFVSKTGAAALRDMQRTDDTAARYARHSVNKISGLPIRSGQHKRCSRLGSALWLYEPRTRFDLRFTAASRHQPPGVWHYLVAGSRSQERV